MNAVKSHLQLGLFSFFLSIPPGCNIVQRVHDDDYYFFYFLMANVF